MLSWVLLAMALPVSPQVGPLLKKAEGAPPAVCSAFVVQASRTDPARVMTAAHCLSGRAVHLWLPGLEGNALLLAKSRWKEVFPFPSTVWTVTPGHDKAWAPGIGPGLRLGAFPRPGDPLTLIGYPQGRGPERVSCVYRGAIVLSGAVPQIRPSVTCPQLPPGPLQGFSGGPVLNAQGEAVGVVVSGVRGPQGWAPGFEPLGKPWGDKGPHQSPFWELGTGVPPGSHIMWEESAQGQVTRFKVFDSNGKTYSFWPPLPSPPPAGGLRP